MRRFALLVLFLIPCARAEEPALLVLHKGASSLGFYTGEGRHLKDVPVGKHPHEMVISPDGRLAYITDNGTMRIEQAGTGGNTVSIVDLVARRKIGEISLGRFRRPHGIALNPKSGLLAVTTELPDQLLLIDIEKRAIAKTFDPKGKTAHMVAWDSEGRWAYISNSNSANVSAIEVGTGRLKRIPTRERPEGSALSPDGRRLYVVNREAERISVIDTVRQELLREIRTGKGPVRIAVTPDGRQLVYALMHESKVEFADAASGRILGQVTMEGEPVSLNLSTDGELAFASAQDIDTVYLISVRERKIVHKFRTAPGARPDPVLKFPTR